MLNVVPKNDNNLSSWLWKGDRERNAQYAQHIPLANHLIKLHCKKWWKNHPESSQYQYAHFGICCQLTYTQDCKELMCRNVALFLECHPMALLNDPFAAQFFND